MSDILQRIKERVQIDPETGCWLWQGAKFTNGYGTIKVAQKQRRVHRVMWESVNGAIPDGLFVCHHCDVKHCCNPAHLFLGTNSDNLMDASRKGRTARGDRHGSKIHPDRVPRGNRHGSRTHPERCPRGDANGSRLHPEKLRRGQSHPNAVLTEQQVREIRELNASGVSYAKLVKMFGIGKTTVSHIVRREYWRHIA